MDFEGEYFVFDWADNASMNEAPGEASSAFAIMRVVNGSLEELFHPDDHAYLGQVGRDEDMLAIKYLKDNNVTKVFTTKYSVEHPDTFLGKTLWWREYMEEPGELPYWDFYVFAGLHSIGYNPRIEILEKNGLEVIVIDPRPYVVKGERPRDFSKDQLEFGF